MGSMPTYHVSKGLEFGYLSALFGPPQANFMAAYDAALAALSTPVPDARTNLKAAARARQTAATAPALRSTDVSHFEEHWLGGAPNGWWPTQAVGETLRGGFREAIEHAKARALPMEVLWVCARDNDFHLYFSESPNQVTVLIFTPPPKEHVSVASPGFVPQPLDHPEDIWVVKREDRFDGAAYQALGSPGVITAPETVDELNGGSRVIKQRLFHTGSSAESASAARS
jgi:hypothetical protein